MISAKTILDVTFCVQDFPQASIYLTVEKTDKSFPHEEIKITSYLVHILPVLKLRSDVLKTLGKEVQSIRDMGVIKVELPIDQNEFEIVERSIDEAREIHDEIYALLNQSPLKK